MRTDRHFSRRALLKSSIAVAAPLVIPSSALGLDGAVAPSNRVTIGMIGTGRQGLNANLPFFLWSPECQVVSVCDVDSWRMRHAKEKVDADYSAKAPSGSYKACDEQKDFRAVLSRKDIDAVMISTPDHWHVYMAIEAAKAGKDVALEKPISLSIGQGRMLADAMKEYDRVFRTDSEVRNSKWFHQACQLARNGRLGKIRRVIAGVPLESKPLASRPEATPPPPELDYEMWLGPAPAAPYTEKRVHQRENMSARPGWMQIRNHCQGMITNWGAHIIDIVQWGLNSEHTGPVEVEGTGTYPKDNYWDVLQSFDIRYRYDNGIELHYSIAGRPFARFEGSEGWVEVEWFKQIRAEPKSLLEIEFGEKDVRLPLISEKEDFISCVKSRKGTVVDAEIGHRTNSVCQIGHIAVDIGRKLRWDPAAERFVGDEEANARLGVAMREPWKI